MLGASSESFQVRQQAKDTIDKFGGLVNTCTISPSNWSPFSTELEQCISVITLLVLHWQKLEQVFPNENGFCIKNFL